MKHLNKFFGLAIILTGIALFFLAIWTGLWYCLVLGIVDIVNQCKAESTDAYVIAFAVVRILFFTVPLVLGMMLSVFVMGLGAEIGFGIINRPRFYIRKKKN